MVTLGDVFTVLALIFGIGGTAWAMTVALALLFPSVVLRAQSNVETKPWACLGRGLLLILIPGVVSIVLLNLPNPLAKLLGWAGLMGLFAVAALGCAGIASRAAGSLRQHSEGVTEFGAFAKGAGILVAGSLLPGLGWFVFGPLLIIAGLGAGWTAVRRRGPAPVGA